VTELRGGAKNLFGQTYSDEHETVVSEGAQVSAFQMADVFASAREVASQAIEIAPRVEQLPPPPGFLTSLTLPSCAPSSTIEASAQVDKTLVTKPDAMCADANAQPLPIHPEDAARRQETRQAAQIWKNDGMPHSVLSANAPPLQTLATTPSIFTSVPLFASEAEKPQPGTLAEGSSAALELSCLETPTYRGSSLHGTGLCRPCAWFWKPTGCKNGTTCAHCHLCPEGELQARRKAKNALLRQGSLEQDCHKQEKTESQQQEQLQTQQQQQQRLEQQRHQQQQQQLGLNHQQLLHQLVQHMHHQQQDLQQLSHKQQLQQQQLQQQEQQQHQQQQFLQCQQQRWPQEDTFGGTGLALPFIAAPCSPLLPTAPALWASVDRSATVNVELANATTPFLSGSMLHGTGACRPCAWFWKADGCKNGQACQYCHLCPKSELKEKRKAKVAALRVGALERAADRSDLKAPRSLKLSACI